MELALIDVSESEALDLLKKWRDEGTDVMVEYSCHDDERKEALIISGSLLGRITEVTPERVVVEAVAAAEPATIRIYLNLMDFKYGKVFGKPDRLCLTRLTKTALVVIGAAYAAA